MPSQMACLDIVLALQSPRETTVSGLLETYNLTAENILSALDTLNNILNEWGVSLDPEIGSGSLDDVRVLRRTNDDSVTSLITDEILRGEGQSIEFKQTLCFDVKKHLVGGKDVKECYSDKVVLSTLKTVAGFLNGSGGVLLVGVSDDGELYSIEKEFGLACPKGNITVDGWELTFRGLIERYFLEGSMVQPYVDIAFSTINECVVARINVGRREKLTFMNFEGTERLYVRVGNRTQSVAISQIEDFFDLGRRN
jgi:Putative DNA-binding domain